MRVADSQGNNPGNRDVVYVTVAAPALGDQETIELQETGFDTGVFEGSVATSVNTGPSGDGVIGAPPGQAIEAVHQDVNLPTSSRADATMVASLVELVDSQGRPAELYLESTKVYLRAVDNVSVPPGTYSMQVNLQADLSGDQEQVTLWETGVDTGIFEGSVDLRQGPGLPGNGSWRPLWTGLPTASTRCGRPSGARRTPWG